MPTRWFPSAADGIGVTPSGTVWTYGPWTVLTTGLTVPSYLQKLAVLPKNGLTMGSQVSVQIQLAVSGGGINTLIGTHRYRFYTTQHGNQSTVPLGLMIGPIGSGIAV